jgi:hypothetical protein
MGILLAFLPFFVFVVVERIWGVATGLVVATLISAGLLIRDALLRNGTVKVLEGLAIYTLLAGPTWSIPAVRLRVDAGLLLVVLVSMAIRQPFTLQYARETVPPELWESPQFVRTNYIITAVWAAAFAVMVAVDLAMLYVPSLPTRVAIIVTILALYGAVRFTGWYPTSQEPKAVGGSSREPLNH